MVNLKCTFSTTGYLTICPSSMLSYSTSLVYSLFLSPKWLYYFSSLSSSLQQSYPTTHSEPVIFFYISWTKVKHQKKTITYFNNQPPSRTIYTDIICLPPGTTDKLSIHLSKILSLQLFSRSCSFFPTSGYHCGWKFFTLLCHLSLCSDFIYQYKIMLIFLPFKNIFYYF